MLRAPCFGLSLAVLLAAGADGTEPPRLFLPGTVSTADANELAATVTPAGDRLYFMRWRGVWGGDRESRPAIFVADRVGDSWGVPVVAAFSDEFADQDPFVSPDGRWLYFVSDRPAPGKETPGADLWRDRPLRRKRARTAARAAELARHRILARRHRDRTSLLRLRP